MLRASSKLALIGALAATGCTVSPADRRVAACIKHADGAPSRVAECWTKEKAR